MRLNRGAADLPGFRAAVHRIAGVHQYGFFEPSEGRPKLQRSVDLQADAMRLLAFVTAIAGALLLGQALLRQAAAGLRAQRTLQALEHAPVESKIDAPWRADFLRAELANISGVDSGDIERFSAVPPHNDPRWAISKHGLLQF